MNTYQELYDWLLEPDNPSVRYRAMIELLDNPQECSATDRRTILVFLQSNGWVVDPAKAPKALTDLLTSKVSATDDLTDDVSPLRIAR